MVPVLLQCCPQVRLLCRKLAVLGAVVCFVLDKTPGLITKGQSKKVRKKSTNAVVVSMKSSEIIRLNLMLRFRSCSRLTTVLFEITFSFPQSLLEPRFLHVSVCRTRVVWHRHSDARI